MTKKELIQMVSLHTGQTVGDVTNTFEATIEVIKKEVAKGNRIDVRGFGSFHRKHRAEKPARIIKTGETIIIPAHFSPAFKASPEFENQVK